MKTKKIYKLTWLTRKPSSYHRDSNGRYYKIYDRINHLKSAITDKQPSRYSLSKDVPKLKEGVDYIVEVCEVPEWEELWQPYELGEWESAADRYNKDRAEWRRKHGLS